ncbi:MAG: Undecaprenyl pyrophosphate synthase UppS [Candidatus Methanohalarchaeum thermophilum]|uniref:Undecaprenyl pyrophosphate synthase UppS n=1 Tax=Methanohalarchaeum thermophilum TaxID=1903181 RepID=A0A1Q6DUR0_METT1|nr:MAG: Undecaprenyl pyrophosphate synthase UppS [Candidatus Methanohalarchaeum thermophilum]
MAGECEIESLAIVDDSNELEEFRRVLDADKWVEEFNIGEIIFGFPNVREEIKRDLKKINERTKREIKLIFVNGREEVTKAVKNALMKILNVNNGLECSRGKLIQDNLDINTELDILVKIGAETAPNCFIWQSSYAELFYVDDWGSLDREKIQEIINEFKERERRFGR